MDDLMERRSMEVLELVVNQRMSQGERVKNPKENKKVPGWFIE